MMTTLRCAILACVAAALAPVAAHAQCASPPPTAPWIRLMERVQASVVGVVSKAGPPGSETTYGSGFVASDGLIITAAHIVDDGKSIMIQDPAMKQWPAELVGYDIVQNVAVLSVPSYKAPALPLAGVMPKTGEYASVAGRAVAPKNPSSQRGCITVQVYESVEAMQIDADVGMGMSGGPIVNESGEVIGMALAIVDAGKKAVRPAFAVGPRDLRKGAAEILRRRAGRPCPEAFKNFRGRFLNRKIPKTRSSPRTSGR